MVGTEGQKRREGHLTPSVALLSVLPTSNAFCNVVSSLEYRVACWFAYLLLVRLQVVALGFMLHYYLALPAHVVLHRPHGSHPAHNNPLMPR